MKILKLKMMYVVYFFWSLILFFRLCINMQTSLVPKPTTFYYITAGIFILLLTTLCVKMKKRSISHKFKYWVIGIALYLITFGIIFMNKLLYELTIFNVIEVTIFYCIVFLMGIYLYHKNSIYSFIRVSYFVLAGILIAMFFISKDGFESPQNIIFNVFAGYERSRYAFGFSHPNTTGNIAMCCLVLSFAVFQQDNIKTKRGMIGSIINCGIDMFLMYMLIASSSRTSITGIFIFTILMIYFECLRKFNNRGVRSFITTIFVIIIAFIIILNGDFSLNVVFSVTNRLYNFTYNIPILIREGCLWRGLGFIGSGDFFNLSTYNTFYVDNYFLYVLMSSGVLGTVFLISFIFYIGIRVFKMEYENYKIGNFIKSVFISNLVISLSETCFMYPSFVSCFIYTAIYMMVICRPKEKKENKSFRKNRHLIRSKGSIL